MRTAAPAFLLAGALGAVALTACRPTYPACGRDADCLGSEVCASGQCQQCRDDAGCPAGQRCETGRCERPPTGCATDVECGAGARCRDGRCLAARREPASTPAAACALVPVPFAFDDASLTPEAREAVAANARCLEARGPAPLVLVGHADARGTEEYNLALGERRAAAVRDYLASFGVDRAGVEVASMGEELASGADEAGFAADRRVDFEAVGATSGGEEP